MKQELEQRSRDGPSRAAGIKSLDIACRRAGGSLPDGAGPGDVAPSTG